MAANPAFVNADLMYPRGHAPSSDATLVDNPHYGSSFSSGNSQQFLANLRNARQSNVDYALADRQPHRSSDDSSPYDALTGIDSRNPARSVPANPSHPTSFGNPMYEFGANRGVYSTVDELV